MYYDPFHRERCIGLSDNGHPCPHDVDLQWRVFAHTEVQLLQDITHLTTRKSRLKSVTKHLLCDCHRRTLVRSTRHRHVSPMVQKQSQFMVQEAPSHPLPRLVGGISQESIGGPVLQRTELPSTLRD
ncbi:hypothetical protein BDQ94DRAFT_164630 [Aspergillus welwitschiae]|uniref:Uncharacterized protein n=1 Tax=Aspergillus welwitschiae TaxID=1341132 RepID=A0A3F3PH35_9EURO|nr:hypothetical protein BDQ94DRAFT_164630 [Aspergillus welwitschiae]RDH26255.1 hypothetical protein BDQ94DRAFT_164630 [Aspergillus welwitschiae]